MRAGLHSSLSVIPTISAATARSGYIETMEEQTSAAPLRRCFVISPIGEDGSEVRTTADQLLRHVIVKGLSPDYEIVRGDQENNPGAITPQIVAAILEADLVVADLSGFNPNVYYEVAVAHGFNKPTVHLQNKNEKPAFDLKDTRLIRYDLSNPDNVVSSQELLKSYALFAATNPEQVVTPLSTAQLFVKIDQSQDVTAQAQIEVAERLRQLEAEVRQSGRVDVDRSADIRGLRDIIEQAIKRHALISDDFRAVVGRSNTEEFYSWAASKLAVVDSNADPALLRRR